MGAMTVSEPAARRALLIWACASFAFNLGFARFSYGLLLPTLHHSFGASYVQLGAGSAVNLVAYLAGTLAVPWLLRSEAARLRLFVVAVALVGVTLLLAALAPNVATVTASRAVMGFVSAVAIALTSIETFERVAPAQRGVASAAMWSGAAIGLALCAPALPLTAGAHPVVSWRVVWLAMAICAPFIARGFITSLRRLPRLTTPGGDDASAPRFDPRDNLRPQRLLFLDLTYFCFGIAYIAYATYAVALFTARGLPLVGIALVWALVGVTSVLGIWWAGAVLDAPAGRYVAAASMAAGGLGTALALGPGIGWAFASATCFGLGFAATPAAITALARKRTSARAYPAAYTWITMMFGSGQFAGPLIAGAFVARSGLAAALAVAVAAYVVGVLCALLDALPTRQVNLQGQLPSLEKTVTCRARASRPR
jgi:predicted MFS family arabinose efflux permease